MSGTIQEIVERETVRDDADDASDDATPHTGGASGAESDAGAVDDAAPADAGEASDDGDVETPQPEAPSTGPTPQQHREAIKAGERYAKRIETIYGDEAEHLAPCPLCPTVHVGFVDERDAGRLPEEVASVVDMFLGRTREVEYPEAPAYSVCTTCTGLGKVRTGSRVPQHETAVCIDCRGFGYMKANEPSVGAFTSLAEKVNGEASAQPLAAGEEVDLQGSPRLLPDGRENPNFGKWPQYRDPAFP